MSDEEGAMLPRPIGDTVILHSLLISPRCHEVDFSCVVIIAVIIVMLISVKQADIIKHLALILT